MSTADIIIELFCRVDDLTPNARKHWPAALHPSEVVTLALLLALKGIGNRTGYTMALFNLLVQWHGLEPEETDWMHLTTDEVSL